MVQLILYALLAAGVAFGGYKIWTGFTGSYIAEGKQIQLKADQPIIDKAKAQAADADERATHAKADTDACVAKADVQSKAVTTANKLAAAAQAETARVKAESKVKDAAAATRIVDLQQRAAAPPVKDMSCEVELGKSKAIIQETLRARRGIPTPVAPGK